MTTGLKLLHVHFTSQYSWLVAVEEQSGCGFTCRLIYALQQEVVQGLFWSRDANGTSHFGIIGVGMLSKIKGVT